jgi:aminoacylase
VPTEAEAGFDCRIPCTVDLAQLEAKVAGWCADAGASYSFQAGTDTGKHEHSQSDVSPDAYWWRRFQAGAAAARAPLHEPSVFSAATDSRWVRMMLGIPCFGFSPMRNTPICCCPANTNHVCASNIKGINRCIGKPHLRGFGAKLECH